MIYYYNITHIGMDIGVNGYMIIAPKTKKEIQQFPIESPCVVLKDRTFYMFFSRSTF